MSSVTVWQAALLRCNISTHDDFDIEKNIAFIVRYTSVIP